jgi:uncharacterized protein
MKCPRTGSALRRVKVGGITVDVSTECGGVFFDNSELEKFDEKHEVRGEVLVQHLSQFEAFTLNEHQRIDCPKCESVVMMRRHYSPLKILEIDECPNCGGIWLDSGELSTLREIFSSDLERKKLREQLIKEVESHPNFVAHQKEHVNSLTSIETFSNILWRIFGR